MEEEREGFPKFSRGPCNERLDVTRLASRGDNPDLRKGIKEKRIKLIPWKAFLATLQFGAAPQLPDLCRY